LHLEGDTSHICPRDPGTRIEIDAQFIRMLEIAGAHGMRVKLEAAQVNSPDKTGSVVNDNLFGCAA
jgi:hypothetical protein